MIMCHALCYSLCMSIQLTLFRKPCRCVCPDPRAGDAPRPGPRPSSTASRSWPTARGSARSARSSASTVFFLIRVEVRSGRELAASEPSGAAHSLRYRSGTSGSGLWDAATRPSSPRCNLKKETNTHTHPRSRLAGIPEPTAVNTRQSDDPGARASLSRPGAPHIQVRT